MIIFDLSAALLAAFYLEVTQNFQIKCFSDLLLSLESGFHFAGMMKVKTVVISLQILGYADHVFTGLFTIEIILKVVFIVYTAVSSMWSFCFLFKLGEISGFVILLSDI